MKGGTGRCALLTGLIATTAVLFASLATAGRLGGWPLAAVGVGVLPFLLMAWGADPASGHRRTVRGVILWLGALWVTGCLGAVFLLAGETAPAWTFLGLPAQLAALLLLLGLGPFLLLGLGYAATFEDEPPDRAADSDPRHRRG
jgi:hypothetical protein